jgi:hypothetical protein
MFEKHKEDLNKELSTPGIILLQPQAFAMDTEEHWFEQTVDILVCIIWYKLLSNVCLHDLRGGQIQFLRILLRKTRAN